MPGLLHAEHSPPKELEASFPRLGAWSSARQFAIFEVLYNFGAAAIPAIKRVAFGAYDWTQGNAIEVLCRLAADGVEKEDILKDLIAHLPAVREEALGYAISPLLPQSEANPSLQGVIQALQVVPNFRSVWADLS